MITVLCGTNRPDSNTKVVASHIVELHRAAGRDVQLLDLAELPAAIFDPSAYAQKPAAFAPFADAVLGSHGLVVVTPEYNGSLPGILKYFIDMLPFPQSFQNRPVCFVGLSAGRWGAVRAVEHLQLIFSYREAHLYPERVFVPSVDDVVDEARLVRRGEINDRLRAQAAGFAAFIEAVRPAVVSG